MTVQDVEKWLESEWAALVSRVHEMFHKTNIEAVPADKGQDIAHPSAPVEAKPAAPVPPTEPLSYAVIRAKIAQFRANGADWPQTMLYVQTGFGLNRALTDDEWKVAIAAGCPPELAAKPSPNTGPSMEEVTAPDTLQFVDGTPAVGQVAFGVAMYLKGNCTKTINGAPENVTVQLYVSDRKAGAYKFSVNGQLVQEITAGIAVQTFPASGPTVTLKIEQPDDCTMLAAIQPA